ncbi:CobQ-like glutamine amidotransferase family enzyme [Microbacterium sp. SORGH_AS428]|uniref:glutamine amidotransferase n=1 Tax=Microbacterium sp. SORGH_AS_0428 TaxID=3041788 RepID=UPI002856F618|nr:glutamine amidotransferase [Microbacterium sp. SORGH_AS_0428]MDR6198507.1 CobQ-like glutamine amidotransferase family enzyme [Microbacterium sp. SORGH_AS_0428]
MTMLRIVQLYPDLLGVTGDRGNVEVLAARASLAGHESEVTLVGIGEAAPAEADVVVIGNGPLSALRVVRDDLASRREWLAALIGAGAVVLAVGGGSELLSEGIDLVDGTHLDGLGLIPARVGRTKQRRVGYVVADTADGKLVGFEDHASLWRLADPGIAYGTVTAGNGGIEGGFETVRMGSVYATNVQGPVLPLNPDLADALLAQALARHDAKYEPGPAHAEIDAHARAARAEIERLAVDKRFTAIQL